MTRYKPIHKSHLIDIPSPSVLLSPGAPKHTKTAIYPPRVNAASYSRRSTFGRFAESAHRPPACRKSRFREHLQKLGGTRHPQAPNLSAARAFALAASSSRFFGGAVVSSECRRRVEIAATSSIAARNAASFSFAGLLKPVFFFTNWSEAARTSSSVTGGSKLKRVLIFRHMQ